MDIVTQIGEALGSWLTLFTTKFIDTINSCTALFYDKENGLSILGILAIAGIATGILFTCFKFARRLLKM